MDYYYRMTKTVIVVVLEILACICVLPNLLFANPFEKVETNAHSVVDPSHLKNNIYRYLQLRHAVTPNPSRCKKQQDCLSDKSVGNVSSDLVNCDLVIGTCHCSKCFMLDKNGTCSGTVCPDFKYDIANRKCSDTDTRKTQLAGFLLTLFVFQVGAANFYIGQNGLGGGQITLFLLIIILSCGICFAPVIITTCVATDLEKNKQKDALKDSFFLIIPMAVIIVLLVFASIALSAWGLADLIIFGINTRLAGNGCTLKPWGAGQ